MNEEEIAAAAAAKAEADAKAAEAVKPDSEKTVDELKAEAEALEAELKNAKGDSSEDDLKANMIRRKEKAAEKLDRLKNGDQSTKPSKSEISVEDLVTLEVRGIEKDSEKAKVLRRYVEAGMVGNYKEGLSHVAVKAELDALEASGNAKTVVDENDSAEKQLKTKKEAVASYKASGEVPEDPTLRKAIVESNLAEMGLG